MCLHIALTLEHLEERLVGCILGERRYLMSKNVAMVDLSIMCIEVLLKKYHFVFLFVVMIFLKFAT